MAVRRSSARLGLLTTGVAEANQVSSQVVISASVVER